MNCAQNTSSAYNNKLPLREFGSCWSSRHLASTIVILFRRGIFNTGVGKITRKVSAILDISFVSSSLTFALSAMECYHAMLHPLSTRFHLSEDNIKQAIAIMWIMALLLSLTAFQLLQWSEVELKCIGPWTLYMTKSGDVYLIVCTVFSTYLSLTIVIYCYGSVNKRLVVTFILATVGFFVCYLPRVIFFTVFVPVTDENKNSKLDSNLPSLFWFLFKCSLGFNPVICAFCSSNFKNGCKRIIICCRSGQNNVWARRKGLYEINVM